MTSLSLSGERFFVSQPIASRSLQGYVLIGQSYNVKYRWHRVRELEFEGAQQEPGTAPIPGTE
jgi:hypothetical protein